jgi:hypothetical protein
VQPLPDQRGQVCRTLMIPSGCRRCPSTGPRRATRLQISSPARACWMVGCLVCVMTDPYQYGLRIIIAASPPAQLVGVLAQSKDASGSRPNQFPVPVGPDEIPRNTAYPFTTCRSANTCLTCPCPASRANFSVTYAHVAVHPQEQLGRLTSRLPSFSGRIVMLWVTLMIFLLLTRRKA